MTLIPIELHYLAVTYTNILDSSSGNLIARTCLSTLDECPVPAATLKILLRSIRLKLLRTDSTNAMFMNTSIKVVTVVTIYTFAYVGD